MNLFNLAELQLIKEGKEPTEALILSRAVDVEGCLRFIKDIKLEAGGNIDLSLRAIIRAGFKGVVYNLGSYEVVNLFEDTKIKKAIDLDKDRNLCYTLIKRGDKNG